MGIWQKGKPLQEAMFAFCDEKYLRAFPKQPKVKGSQPGESEKFWDIVSGAIHNLTEMQKETDNFHNQQKLAWDNLLKNLFEKIQNKELMATGFEIPIQSDIPVEIPEFMWPPEEIKEKESVISACGKTFVRVRIIRNTEIKDVSIRKTKSLPDTEIQNGKVGRPSAKEAILSTYERLKKENRIDYTKPFQAHHKLLIDSVLALHGVEVSGKTLHKYLGHQFKTKKKSTN